jgi:hypothetical protein
MRCAAVPHQDIAVRLDFLIDLWGFGRHGDAERKRAPRNRSRAGLRGKVRPGGISCEAICSGMAFPRIGHHTLLSIHILRSETSDRTLRSVRKYRRLISLRDMPVTNPRLEILALQQNHLSGVR